MRNAKLSKLCYGIRRVHEFCRDIRWGNPEENSEKPRDKEDEFSKKTSRLNNFIKLPKGKVLGVVSDQGPRSYFIALHTGP
jgi:hypothetical protein